MVGAIAVVLLGEFRAGRPTASPGVPAYAGAYYVMHLLSSMVMSSAALSDRNARHTSIALLLAPSRYVNWALQVREAVFAAPHGFPLFGVAMGCEAVRVAHGMLYALVGHRAWRRHVALDANFVPFCTALAESAVFFVSVANREPLLKVRWARAPQLVQGLLLGVERAVVGGRSNGRPKPRSPSVDDDAAARADEPWVPATARTMKVRVYRYDAAGDDAYVDMAVAPGKWTVSGYVEAKIADAPLDVRIKGAMRELARVDGSAILGVERCVAKAYTRDTKEWLWEHQKVGDAVYFRDVYVHERTAALARDFNGAAAAAGVAARVDVGAAAVVEIISVAGDGDAAFALGSDRRYVHVEPFIDGAYERFNKYNSNTFNALLLLSDRHAETISGAFSHFTYERSTRELVVCDIQGVRTASDTLTITDPQIHTCRSCDDFGAGNGQSLDHIRAFFASHECKGCCRALGLAHPYPEDLATGITKVHRSFSWSPFFLRKNYFAAGLLQSLLFAGPSTTPAAGKGD